MKLTYVQKNEIEKIFSEIRLNFPNKCHKRLKENIERILSYPERLKYEPIHNKQRPTLHFYHGLENRPYWDTEEFNLNELTTNRNEIKFEYNNFMKNLEINSELETFRDGSGDIPDYLIGNLRVIDVITPSIHFGIPAFSPISESSFPITRKSLCSIPLFTNSSFFSLMHIGTHLKAHCSESNVRLTIHLGIDIPLNSSIKVADEKKEWLQDNIIVFDGSFEHEAWNFGDRTRSILIAYLWHPDLSLPERIFIDRFDLRVLSKDKSLNGI